MSHGATQTPISIPGIMRALESTAGHLNRGRLVNSLKNWSVAAIVQIPPREQYGTKTVESLTPGKFFTPQKQISARNKAIIYKYIV